MTRNPVANPTAICAAPREITGEASKLRLESNCAGEWIVRNDNDQAQKFTWNIQDSNETSSGIVADTDIQCSSHPAGRLLFAQDRDGLPVKLERIDHSPFAEGEVCAEDLAWAWSSSDRLSST
jgi:hypothetical protein